MKKLVVTLIAMSLTGCIGQKVILQNQEGKQVQCEYSTGAAMLTGVAWRNIKINQCVQQYQSNGYTKVVEAEHKI